MLLDIIQSFLIGIVMPIVHSIVWGGSVFFYNEMKEAGAVSVHGCQVYHQTYQKSQGRLFVSWQFVYFDAHGAARG